MNRRGFLLNLAGTTAASLIPKELWALPNEILDKEVTLEWVENNLPPEVQTFSDIILHTLKNKTQIIEDNISKHNALYLRLKAFERSRIHNEDEEPPYGFS